MYVRVFNMIKRIHDVKALIKHISCDLTCKFHSETSHLNQKQNNDKCQCKCKKSCMYKNDYIWNPSTNLMYFREHKLFKKYC